MGKRIFAVIAVMVIAALTLGTMIGSGVGQVSLTETPTYSGHISVEVNGTNIYEGHNFVTAIGKARVTDYLQTGTIGADPATEFISLSLDVATEEATVVPWTKLPGEYTEFGLTRADGEVTEVSDTEFTVSYKFNCTADSKMVRASGLHWMLTGDLNMWAAADFGETTLDSGDNITITWTVTHT